MRNYNKPINCVNDNCNSTYVSADDVDTVVQITPYFVSVICVRCRCEGYKSPEEIISDCDLDDEELEGRTIVVDAETFNKPLSFGTEFICPVCGSAAPAFERSHGEIVCTCHTCNEIVIVVNGENGND